MYSGQYVRVTFQLGPVAAGEGSLNSRHLTIKALKGMNYADNVTEPPAAQYNTQLAGTVTEVTVNLPVNQMWQATLKDYGYQGAQSATDVLNFSTGMMVFPGPKSQDRLSISKIDAASSSSSSSSST